MSALAFLVLGYALIRYRKQLEYQRQLWNCYRAGSTRQWLLDWPHAFLRKFCHTIGCPGPIGRQQDKPCRIYPKSWLDLDRDYRIVKIEIVAANELMVTIGSGPSQEELASRLQQLTASLDQQYHIRCEQKSR
jgi:hypothetical protein